MIGLGLWLQDRSKETQSSSKMVMGPKGNGSGMVDLTKFEE